MTTRGLVEKDFVNIAEFLDRGIKISLDMQAKTCMAASLSHCLGVSVFIDFFFSGPDFFS